MRTGDHIKISCGFYSHHGVYLGGGQVIHFAGIRGKNKDDATIRLCTIERFAGERGVPAIEIVEYGASFPGDVVAARARGQLGRSGYHLFNNNCEQFARWCKTGHWLSEQVEGAKAAGGGLAGGAAATVAATGVVSAAGLVAGTSGAGVMSGLAAVGGVVGGGAAVGVGVLAAAPAAAATLATQRLYRDDAMLPAHERSARQAARTAGKVGAAAATLGTVGLISAAGVPGLSAVGISSGLAAIGGSMIGGVAVAVAAPAGLALGLAFLVHRLVRRAP